MTFQPPDPATRHELHPSPVPPPPVVAPQDSGVPVRQDVAATRPAFGVPVLPGVIADGTLRNQSAGAPSPTTPEVQPTSETEPRVASPIGEPANLQPLTSITRLRVLSFVLAVVGVGAWVAAPRAGLLMFLMASACLITWSYLAIANTGRAIPSSPFSKAQSPIAVVVMWFAPALLVAGLFVYGMLSYSGQDTVAGENGSSPGTSFVLVLLFGLGLLFCAYLPYGYLAKATARVHGDGDRFKRWFWLPILTSIGAGFVRVMLVTIIDGPTQRGGFAEDPSATADYLALGVLLASAVVPIIVWFISGNRAMEELEVATQRKWDSTMTPGAGMGDAGHGERLQSAANQRPTQGVNAPNPVG